MHFDNEFADFVTKLVLNQKQRKVHFPTPKLACFIFEKSALQLLDASTDRILDKKKV